MGDNQWVLILVCMIAAIIVIVGAVVGIRIALHIRRVGGRSRTNAAGTRCIMPS